MMKNLEQILNDYRDGGSTIAEAMKELRIVILYSLGLGLIIGGALVYIFG